MEKDQAVIVLHAQDDVAIAARVLTAGDVIHSNGHANTTVTIVEDVPKGHKVALRTINKGEVVHKFGYSIGRATQRIHPGTWVHTHNLETGLSGILSYDYHPAPPSVHPSQATSTRTFKGFVRANGDVGVRNEIWILNTVGCINKTCEIMAREANVRFQGRVDGVYHFAHPFGCSQLGDDLIHTQKLLSSLAAHPNAGGVLIVGLGCENNQIESFQSFLPSDILDKVRFLKVQEVEDEIEQGLVLLEELVAYAEAFKRESLPLSKLKVGLKCGGSDGFSGITANPLVGALSDVIVHEAGTTILTEVPEMFGAEEVLMSRAVNEGVFQDIVGLINDFKKYFMRHDEPIYENPSPGNRAGGITTLEEKSLGCIQKGGYAPVVAVIGYGDRAQKHGFNLLQGPGNDLVSVTALAAAGAHVVLFTTGRGTPFGGPVPTVKISTNTELAVRKKQWIDFDAGPILEGTSIEEMRDQLVDFVVSVASGEQQARNEIGGYREIAIFKDGVIL
jgi:altronate hydrolase